MADQKLSELTELAAQPAVDDEVYIRDISEAAADESKRITIANLLAGAGAATMEFFIPIGHGHAALEVRGDYSAIKLDAVAEHAYFSFRVPADFTTLTHCKAIIIGGTVTDEAIDWTVTTDFGADGEGWAEHSDSTTADGFTLAWQNITTIDISAAFTGLAANDNVGIKFNVDAVTSTWYLVGLTFKYA